MTEPEWQSQVGQDKWAFETLGPGHHTFLDIGCAHTQERSNSWALEQLGWTGLRIDRGEFAGPPRTSPFLQTDVTTIDWVDLLHRSALWPSLGYLSLDVDQASWDVLSKLPFEAGWSFQCATIEHDDYAYPAGESPRVRMRERLLGHGYILARPDVEDQGLKFEDWWVHPSLVPR